MTLPENEVALKVLEDTSWGGGHSFHEKVNRGDSLLVNPHGIEGMGKGRFLQEMMGVVSEIGGHNIIIEIPRTPSERYAIKLGFRIADLIEDAVLHHDKPQSTSLETAATRFFSGMAGNWGTLGERFYLLSQQLRGRKDVVPFALGIHNFDHFPFDDRDAFQNTVLEPLSTIPGFITVVTTMNELSWHTWDLRQKCVDIKLPAYSYEKVEELAQSKLLAKEVYALSGGHPSTVMALIKEAQTQIRKPLSTVTETDLVQVHDLLFGVLHNEIEKNLRSAVGDAWLREMFYVASVADQFDADLVGDLAAQFHIDIPDMFSDIAWEMAYTGLAGWDFDKRAYLIVAELRNRIVPYMREARFQDYVKALFTLADTYFLRAEIIPEKEHALVWGLHYFYDATEWSIPEDQLDIVDIGALLREKLTVQYKHSSPELLPIVDRLLTEGPSELL